MTKLIQSSDFGKTIAFDTALKQINQEIVSLALRKTNENLLCFLSPENFLIEIVTPLIGQGPGRIVTEEIPSKAASAFTANECSLRKDGFYIAEKNLISFNDASEFNATLDTSVKDFPGHLSGILRRLPPLVSEPFEKKLIYLANALREAVPEGVEPSLMKIIGYEDSSGFLPAGDRALSGMLLTGFCLKMGVRIRSDWFSRLGCEVRKLLHRTSPISAAHLKFSLEGRANNIQQKFFRTMASDHEPSIEQAFNELKSDDFNGGPFFLAGVRAAVQMIHPDMFK
ncbi:MAG: DUF2877 domain-containing protein [Candidatus Riflebacteria bacterium]|nr:DUF2877 domain-containing protein [Candidatus Riflebacteria bacterium]